MSKKRQTSDRHIDAAKQRLVHLQGLAEQTDATERRILAAAEERLGVVRAELDQLRPRVNLDDAAAEQYKALTVEVGKLETVIARAREALSS